MLKDKIAVITGGTRGIGFETAKKFLDNNAKVAILGSKEESVNNAINKLKEINPNYEVIGLFPNLTNELELKETYEKELSDIKEKQLTPLSPTISLNEPISLKEKTNIIKISFPPGKV